MRTSGCRAISLVSFPHVLCSPDEGLKKRLLLDKTLEGTRRVGGLLGVTGRLSGTVSPFRAEQGTSLETPSGAAGNPRFPRLLPGTLGNFPGCL